MDLGRLEEFNVYVPLFSPSPSHAKCRLSTANVKLNTNIYKYFCVPYHRLHSRPQRHVLSLNIYYVTHVVRPTVRFSDGSFMTRSRMFDFSFIKIKTGQRIPVAARSKSYVCGRTLAGISSSNLVEGIAVSFVNFVPYQIEVSATADPSTREVLPSVVCLSGITVTL